MREISRIEFQKDDLIIRFNDATAPTWVEEEILVVNWRQDAHLRRLAHVGYHCFHLLIEHPDFVEKNDEVLHEWLGKLFSEHPAEEHDAP